MKHDNSLDLYRYKDLEEEAKKRAIKDYLEGLDNHDLSEEDVDLILRIDLDDYLYHDNGLFVGSYYDEV